MKLCEIKGQLIHQFFSEESSGVSDERLDEIFESLGKIANVDLNFDRYLSLSQISHNSHDPSKAFKMFTEGKISLLSILEEDGIKVNVILSAIRVGKKVFYTDLTKSTVSETVSDFLTIKNIIRQAKNINDDVYYNIISE